MRLFGLLLLFTLVFSRFHENFPDRGSIRTVHTLQAADSCKRAWDTSTEYFLSQNPECKPLFDYTYNRHLLVNRAKSNVTLEVDMVEKRCEVCQTQLLNATSSLSRCLLRHLDVSVSASHEKQTKGYQMYLEARCSKDEQGDFCFAAPGFVKSFTFATSDGNTDAVFERFNQLAQAGAYRNCIVCPVKTRGPDFNDPEDRAYYIREVFAPLCPVVGSKCCTAITDAFIQIFEGRIELAYSSSNTIHTALLSAVLTLCVGLFAL